MLSNQSDAVDYNYCASAAFEQELPHCIFCFSPLLVFRLNLEIHTELHRTFEIFKGAGLRIKQGAICSRVEQYHQNFVLFWYGCLWLLLLPAGKEAEGGAGAGEEPQVLAQVNTLENIKTGLDEEQLGILR